MTSPRRIVPGLTFMPQESASSTIFTSSMRDAYSFTIGRWAGVKPASMLIDL